MTGRERLATYHESHQNWQERMESEENDIILGCFRHIACTAAGGD
jgi:hypothetical protein